MRCTRAGRAAPASAASAGRTADSISTPAASAVRMRDVSGSDMPAQPHILEREAATPAAEVPLEQTATRLWKRMGREERLAAARHFFVQPPPEVFGSAVAALVKARHLRPQVARAMPAEEQARALAAVADPGESVASSLVVALHLGERREILKTFLDAAGLPHEEGLLKEDDDGARLGEAQ